MGFNSGFKGLIVHQLVNKKTLAVSVCLHALV